MLKLKSTAWHLVGKVPCAWLLVQEVWKQYDCCWTPLPRSILPLRLVAIPLHYAAPEGHVDVIRLLMASRADVKAKTDRGETPLDMATASAQYALIAGWQRSAASRWAGKKKQTLVCSLDHVLNAFYPTISYYTLFTSDSCNPFWESLRTNQWSGMVQQKVNGVSNHKPVFQPLWMVQKLVYPLLRYSYCY